MIIFIYLQKDHTEKVFRPHIRKVVSDSHPTKSDYPFFDINGENGLQFVGCSINTIEEVTTTNYADII